MTIDTTHMLAADGPIARRLDGWEVRPQQIEMASAITATMDASSHLIAEAPTGIGKSFAYLLPAIRRVVEHGERVVIATHTINLQEQLIDKDIPLLNAVIPDEFTAVLVKGRANYVSLRRLKLASERQDRLFPDDHARGGLHRVEDWAYDTTDGSLASLPQVPPADVWDAARSDSHNCMGRACDWYDACFYQSARRRMEHGQLLITNHALYFADLAMRAGGAGFLPTHQHVILDEAHGIEDIAADHFGGRLAESRVTHLLRQLYDPRSHKGFLAALRLKDGSMARVDKAVESSMDARIASNQLFDDIRRWWVRQSPSGVSRSKTNGRLRDAGLFDNELTPTMLKLADRLRILKEYVAREADAYELNSYAMRAEQIGQDARTLIEQRIAGCVYFVDHTETRGRRRGMAPRVALGCTAVDVAPILRQHLFDQDQSVTLTSATLATGPGDFSHIVRRVGAESAKTMQLESPFNIARQMEVVVDSTMPDPSHPAWLDELSTRVNQLVRESKGGAFVLFTSFAALETVAARLRAPLTEAGYPVLVHGSDGPTGLLLNRFRSDPTSVLFGTSSFWQGVDVRGDGLRLVVITRLPFEVPDRPIVEARHERMRKVGENPFMHDTLPRAVIRFRQGVGRLIRSAQDHGTVAVLDARLGTKPYGRVFTSVFPEGIRVRELRADDHY